MTEKLVKLDELKAALARLKEGLVEVSSQLEKDGVLQRFEFTFELTWKVIQEYAKYQGVEVVSPREAFRVAGELRLISDPERWYVSLKDRNLAAHIYDASMADQILSRVPGFASETEKLVKAIEKVVN